MFAFLFSCEDDEERLFDKTADERASEAIASLRQELTAPANGWLLRYRPQDDAGSYYVLLRFINNSQVSIKTDLGASNGDFFADTIYYRIDNSMGLELIFENYSFFSFLFEQEGATFGAEYEFDYVNKTPDNALVFRSKTDVGLKDIILFEPASSDSENLLGRELATGLNAIRGDFDKFTTSVKLTYTNKDLALYISMDEFRRTLNINAASLKSNTSTSQSVNFSTPYILEGDRIVFDEVFEGTILNNPIRIESLRLSNLVQSTINVCANPITAHGLSGQTSAGDNISFQTTLSDISGRSFAQRSDFYFTPLTLIFNDGFSATQQIANDLGSALEFHMYYGLNLGGGDFLYGIGFVLLNSDGSVTFALRRFTPTLVENRLVFDFESEISLFGNPNPDDDIEKIYPYLDALTEGDNTYVFQLQDDVYEFFNPCTRWSFVFINANR
jgi:hypothetical protein